MASRNLNQLKFFILLLLFFLDTNATCLRLETFDQAEVKTILIKKTKLLKIKVIKSLNKPKDT